MAKSRKKTVKKKVAGSSETAILDAFVELAQFKGVASVTLQDVAESAEVAFGTVRYHFSEAGLNLTQEALIHVIKKAYAFIDERLYASRTQPDFNPLHAYVRAMFEWAKSYRADGSLLVYYYYLCTTKTQVAIPNAVFLERARLRVESLVHESVGRALYAPVIEPVAVATKIHLQVLGACLIAGTLGTDEGYESQLKMCLELADQTVRASAVKPTPQSEMVTDRSSEWPED
jgi:AcrR family transcriptional regulator